MISTDETLRSITIVDIVGNVVLDEQIQCPAPCEKKINMGDMKQGIYFCRIILDNGEMVLMKVLKE
jgi:hypothetical protein